MAIFTNFTPQPGQTDIARTSGLNFTVLVDATGVQIATLNAKIGDAYAIQSGGFVNGYSGRIFTGTGSMWLEFTQRLLIFFQRLVKLI